MKSILQLDMSPLNDALKKISNNVSSDKLGSAVLAGLFTLEAHAKLNVRNNFKQRTGFLAANWDTKLDETSKNKAIGHTGPLAVYGRIQELGGVIRSSSGSLRFQTDDGEWHVVKAVTIPARPYLRPAADENKDDIFMTVGNILHDLIEG